ncbi:MAG: MFS transporter [Desulfamplus sp.]|nr:MFS transporter [Desulfamplus sp.]
MPIYNIAKSFFALLFSTLALSAGSALQNTLLSVMLRYAGHPEYMVGIVMSAYNLGMIMGFFICQKLVQRVGHIRAFTALSAIASCVAICHGLYQSLLFWFVLRFISGICIASLYMVVESWLNEMVDQNIRGRILSIYMIIVYFGNGLGQLMINTAGIEGKEIFMILGMVFAFCIPPMALTRAINPRPLQSVQFDFVKLMRLAPSSMFGTFTSGLVLGAFYVMGPVYCIDSGIGISQITVFMMVTVWSGLLFQWPVGMLSDRFNRLNILAGLGIFAALISIIMIFAGSLDFTHYLNLPDLAIFAHLKFNIMLLLTALFGVVFTIYPVSLARAQDNIDQNNIIPVSAALILCYSAGSAFGPVLSSALMHRVGPSGLYIFCALTSALMGCASLYLRFKRGTHNRISFTAAK